jgi:uncharacterized membrane protein YeaQ/YmgE (transglycosylase-associated protein family)
MGVDLILGCVAIGVGAALAAMTWPFRRGPVGVVLNIVTGVTGAVGVAALTYRYFPVFDRTALAFATGGAIFVLLLSHGIWLAIVAHKRRRHAS